ncbi:TniQ family protein [Paraburkholderia sp. BR10936]|uniref:TniQ family protein n=1 Tax=Paraburkholderia sp. BR10936 TaxID=3236993 RepID=UPI0034D1F16E
MKASVQLVSIPSGWPDDAPPRSACFGLTPEGESGESYEDLVSYFRRLCACHGIFPHSFAWRIRPLFENQEVCTPNFNQYATVMNGVTGGAATWVDVLEKLTLRTDLILRTLLPLRGLIGRTKLLCRKERFCPSCYCDDEIQGRPKYNRLLWSIDCVEACPLHRTLLETAPEPSKRIRFTFWLPGISRLDGSSLANHEVRQASSQQVQKARLIADLLDEIHEDPEAFANGAPICEFLQHAAITLFDGKISKLFSYLRCGKLFYRWKHGVTKPSLPLVARIASAFDCNISDILLGRKVPLKRIVDLSFDFKRLNCRRHFRIVESSEALLTDLRNLESSGMAKNLNQTCRLLDVNKDRLRKLAPDIVARIVKIGREDRHRQKFEREEANFNNYWQCYQELRSQHVQPTRDRVSSLVSQRTGRKFNRSETSKFQTRASRLSAAVKVAEDAPDKPPSKNRVTTRTTNSCRKRH